MRGVRVFFAAAAFCDCERVCRIGRWSKARLDRHQQSLSRQSRRPRKHPSRRRARGGSADRAWLCGGSQARPRQGRDDGRNRGLCCAGLKRRGRRRLASFIIPATAPRTANTVRTFLSRCSPHRVRHPASTLGRAARRDYRHYRRGPRQGQLSCSTPSAMFHLFRRAARVPRSAHSKPLVVRTTRARRPMMASMPRRCRRDS